MADNSFYSRDLGFKIIKPNDWEFLPTEWTMSFRRRMDPSDEELTKVMSLARMPLVVLRYDHKGTKYAYPTVQVTCRPIGDAEKINREDFLEMTQEQLKKVYEDIDIIDATTDMQISNFSANRVISKFTISTSDGKEFKCLSRSYVVFVRKLGFTIGMSGPSEGPHQRNSDFNSILESIAIE